MCHEALFRGRMLLLVASLAALSLTNAIAETGVESLEPDLNNGEEINETCAGCHGQGGKEGEYPRLAGQPMSFIVKQLLLFRDRTRPNLAMVEYADHRQMPDQDIVDISAYLSAIELPSTLPPADENAPGFNAYQRLPEAKRVVQIPRAESDVENGKRLSRECRSCHGSDSVPRKTRVATASSRWLEISMAVSCCRSASKPKKLDRAAGSRSAVGSSSIRRPTWRPKAMLISSSCFCPPESLVKG